MNTFVNYGGRNSLLCFNMPLIGHALLVYSMYYCYFNVSLYNIYIFLLIILFLMIEWIIVMTYEYIYLFNYNVNNNMLYNVILFILLEIVLFGGIYWLYMTNVLHYNILTTSYSNYTNYSFSSLTLFSSYTYNNTIITDITLYIIMSNLLILLCVTLLIQLVHRLVLIGSTNSNMNSNISYYLNISNMYELNMNKIVIVINLITTSHKLIGILNGYNINIINRISNVTLKNFFLVRLRSL